MKIQFMQIQIDVALKTLTLGNIHWICQEAMCLSSTILLFYNLVKLSKSGDGLKGAIINLASNLNERVLLPRKDACKYISATIIGRKVNKTTYLKYPLYFANKEIQGLKSNLDKLNN